ncbi:MAG: FAD-dependent oxidoreductase, partial [Verrucomicrobiota bacterium]
GSFSAGASVTFQQLVLALGAEVDLSRVPGMPEHAFLMQNVGDAMILRSTILSRVEEANVATREDGRRRLLTFVVVGGGYSGVETAGEILDMLHEAIRYYVAIQPEEIRVVLVHSRSHILPTLSKGLSEYAMRKLGNRGLELCLEERVSAVTASRVYLQSGKIIETNTVVSTVGNAPNRVIADLIESYDLPHQRSWIQTDEFLQVPGYDFLWAAGDCGAVPMPGSPGERCPQTAQFASRQGEALAKNLMRKQEGKPLKAFHFKGMGELASIGHRTAVANIMGIRLSGFVAWFLWRSIYLMKLPRLDRRMRVMIDWTLDLFFPRDITLLSPRYTSLYREVHLEDGDRLFNYGEPAFSLYVVKAGAIELQNQEGTTVRVIEEGDFFGERALVHGGGYLYNAVARGATKLLSVGGEVILPFFQTSRRFGRVLSRTTAQGSAEDELKSVKERLDPSLLEHRVHEVMRKDVATLRETDSVRTAIDLFCSRRFSIYPLVSGADSHLVGAIDREDFFSFMKKEAVGDDTVIREVDRTHLPTCRETDSVEAALEHMIRGGNYKCLVVDEGNRLQGIITVMDLLTKGIEKRAAEEELAAATS